MILARAPLRISIAGGGTDLPSYYRKRGGFVVSAAINKHVYVGVNPTFDRKLRLKYSEIERVDTVAEVSHPLIREALRFLGFPDRPGLEITSMADIPSGTGLGSSGSFTVALLRALMTAQDNQFPLKNQVAEAACAIEIDQCRNPVGKQDQYVASFGGFAVLQIGKDGNVTVEPECVPRGTIQRLEQGLVLFYTGRSRAASTILRAQDEKTRTGDKDMLANLDAMKDSAYEALRVLRSGDVYAYAGIMNEHWQRKKERSPGMTDPRIDGMYETAMKNGAAGGKLLGAGGGGFLLFYARNRERLCAAMREFGADPVPVVFDIEGAKVLVRT